MDLARTLVAFIVEFPFVAAGLLWWAAARGARRAGTAMAWLGPLALIVWLYKNRRDLRGVIVWACVVAVGVTWIVLLWTRPQVRVAVGIGIPTGVALRLWWWWVSTWPHLTFAGAVRVWWAMRGDREVLTDATHAVVGDTARVVKVFPPAVPGGPVEAEIIGPAGMGHVDLIDQLRDKLAPAVLAVSGRPLHDVSVLSTGAKGRVRVRCLTSDPLAAAVRMDEL